MKRLVALVFISVALIGCDLFFNGELSISIDVDELVTYAKKAAPLFENSLLARSGASRSIIPRDDPTKLTKLNLAYVTFKDYDITRPDDTAAQGVDGSNIWVSLYQAMRRLSGFLPNGTEYNTPTVVNPTFALSAGSGVAYQYYGESEESTDSNDAQDTWAANITETTNEMLIATNMREGDTSKSKSILYLKHDSSTGDLLMDVNYLVEYQEGSTMAGTLYSPKVWVRGNTLSQQCEVIASNYSDTVSSTNGYFESLIGAGVNTGSGEYMIFRWLSARKEGAGAWVIGTDTDKWYKIPADSGSADLEGADAYDSLAALVAAVGDPKEYGTKAAALDIITSSDIGTVVVDSLTSFTADNVLDLQKPE